MRKPFALLIIVSSLYTIADTPCTGSCGSALLAISSPDAAIPPGGINPFTGRPLNSSPYLGGPIIQYTTISAAGPPQDQYPGRPRPFKDVTGMEDEEAIPDELSEYTLSQHPKRVSKITTAFADYVMSPEYLSKLHTVEVSENQPYLSDQIQCLAQAYVVAETHGVPVTVEDFLHNADELEIIRKEPHDFIFDREARVYAQGEDERNTNAYNYTYAAIAKVFANTGLSPSGYIAQCNLPTKRPSPPVTLPYINKEAITLQPLRNPPYITPYGGTAESVLTY